MRRLSTLALFVGLVAIGVGASSVLAGSSRTTATYWSNAVSASTFSSSVAPAPKFGETAVWLGYGKSATWTFKVAGIPAMSGSVSLNFDGYSISLQDGGGAGFDTTMKVSVSGVSTATLTGTLNNTWQPHVAYNADPPTGWEAHANMLVPTSVWNGANTLTVTVASMTTNSFMGVTEDSLHVGYTSIG